MDYDKLTDSQKAAVNQKGSIIVSAAAGSGKTAVLVERIISELTAENNPLSADRILVVTFTVAAAAEMRSRLEKGIDEYCRAHPENTGAVRQKLLLQSAKISTIDSFCIDMVRENFSKAGVSPDFKIAEDKDIVLMGEAAINKVFEKHFESEDKEFIQLLDAFGSTYDEKNLADAVELIYEKSQNLPFPENWLSSMLNRYNAEAFDMWTHFAYEEAIRRIGIAKRFVLAANDCFIKDEAVAKGYSESFNNAAEQLDNIAEAARNGNWDLVCALSNAFKFAKFGSVKGSGSNPNAITAKALRELCDNQVEKLAKLFSEDLALTKSLFLDNAGSNRMLLKLALEYTEALNEIKKEKNLYTFSDIEHFAFSLVCKLEGDVICFNEGAEEFINDYDEILVDEYQDVNDLQDKFFHYLSDCGKRLFVVGDVKQSIYVFRGANPENFIQRIEGAVDYRKAVEGERKSITLDANFRSRKGVCDCVNFMFDHLMTKDNCGISYRDTERLDPRADFPESSVTAAEVHLIDPELLGDKEAEAIHIADCIEGIINAGELVYDKELKAQRPVRYSDFAVLLRAMKGNASFIAAEFSRRGIPVSYTKDSFTESKEVGIMLALLKVIDNPTREVELLSAMMSPMFRFTPDDMAEIRSAKRKIGLYSAVCASAEGGNEKAKKFIKVISDLRKSAVILPLPKLISKIYDMTGFLSIAEMMTDGQARRANLLRIIELASSFSASGNNSIGSFLNNLKKLDNGKLKGATMTAGSNSVKLMSVHNSKGLQFPICIFGFTGSSFNTKDQRKNVIIDTKHGISFKYYNETEGGVVTLDKKLITQFCNDTLLREELRMFYVAATRAQERLIITMAKKNPQDALHKIALKLSAANGIISEDIYGAATGFSDWIIPCMLIHPDGAPFRTLAAAEFDVQPAEGEIKVGIYRPEKREVIKSPEAMAPPDMTLAQAIKERIGYTYPFDELRKIEAKASVSDIVHKAETGVYDFTSRPGFLNKNGLTPTGRGIAVHKIMQFMDFAAARKDFDGEIDRLREWEFITESEAEVDTAHIRRFVRSELFDRISAALKVEREMQFLTYMPACEVEKGVSEALKNEKIIVQGAVDLMFHEADGIVIVDFKTDRVKEEKQLIDSYGEQLRIYAEACEKITGMPVKEKIIYSLVLDSAIVV
ncbi:MAG: helicase-exonuclease AddAB subunit AddA [Clostridia bacterium]|nr:helicase-exonuclease AddAB subunit AddA [Clostridia bacterium]